MWILEWIGWLELGKPEVEADDDDDDEEEEEEEKRGRIVTRSHLEPPRQQCSAVYAPAEAKQWSNQCFYQWDAKKISLAEWHHLVREGGAPSRRGGAVGGEKLG